MILGEQAIGVREIPVGESVRLLHGPVQVRPRCAFPFDGWLYCETHESYFQTRSNPHLRTGRHALVWMCHTHGPEQI